LTGIIGCVEFRWCIICCRFYSALPSSPTAIAVVHITATTVRLIWAFGDSRPDPTLSYTLSYREVDSGADTEREVSNIRTTEYRVTGLSAYTTYRFRVSAVSNVGRSLSSSPLEVTTDELGQLQTFLFFRVYVPFVQFMLTSVAFDLRFSQSAKFTTWQTRDFPNSLLIPSVL